MNESRVFVVNKYEYDSKTSTNMDSDHNRSRHKTVNDSIPSKSAQEMHGINVNITTQALLTIVQTSLSPSEIHFLQKYLRPTF